MDFVRLWMDKMRKIFFLTLFLITSCTNIEYFSDTADEVYEENLVEGKVIDYNTQSLYEVTSSDSLASIARRYGTTANTLILINNLRRPYNLKPGMLIKVPTIKTVDTSGKVSGNEVESAENQKIIHIKPSSKKTPK